MRIILASDHWGFELKNKVMAFLASSGFEVVDAGADTYDPEDDFPDYARKAFDMANADDIMILSCWSGDGMSMAINRFYGWRAAVAGDEESAALSRNDDDTNALCLPARIMENDWDLCQKVITTWLNTPFSGEERFKRRNAKLDKIREGV